MKSNREYLPKALSMSAISPKRKAVSVGLTASLGIGVVLATYLSAFPTLSNVTSPQTNHPPQSLPNASPISAETAQQITPLPPALLKITDVCSVFKDKLPPNYVVYAGGDYKGRQLGYQIDQSGHEATGFEVRVNIPNHPVVLALGAYEPSVWNIQKDKNTQIVGVFVSGYHRQKVTGLDANVPVLNSSYEDRTPCGFFYLTRENVRSADEVLRNVLGKSAESYYLATQGQVLFGGQGVFAGPSVESVPVQDYPLAGKMGLDALEAEGALRPAGEEDLAKFYEEKRNAQGLSRLNIVGGESDSSRINSSSMMRLGAYVVLKPITFPAGLYGAHSVTFIVQRGVPRPRGNPGHSAVYDMNTFTCMGALCR